MPENLLDKFAKFFSKLSQNVYKKICEHFLEMRVINLPGFGLGTLQLPADSAGSRSPVKKMRNTKNTDSYTVKNA